MQHRVGARPRLRFREQAGARDRTPRRTEKKYGRCQMLRGVDFAVDVEDLLSARDVKCCRPA